MTVRENERTVRKGERTRQAILNAAEAQFALSGYEAVSIRQVADAAAQHLGVVTYHYPNKELLFEAVIARRAEELTQRRKERLSDLADPTIESLLDAFLDPFREKVEGGSDGWRRYAQILAHIAQDARWAPLVDRLFGETGRKFISLMREVEPRLTLDTATQGYVHLISVMVGLFASTKLLDRLSNGKMSSDRLSENYDQAIAFLAGGMRALAAQMPSTADAKAFSGKAGIGFLSENVPST